MALGHREFDGPRPEAREQEDAEILRSTADAQIYYMGYHHYHLPGYLLAAWPPGYRLADWPASPWQ
eukprot:4132168-Heterocapsa_arctica.AAC.1